LNLSDSFVAAWLPGSEGKGVADVLFRGADGKVAHDFNGTLSFSWPKSACQTPLNVGDKNYAPLFKVGYGLKYGKNSHVGTLANSPSERGCGNVASYPIFVPGYRASWPLAISSGSQRQSLGRDLASEVALPTIKVEITDVSNQQDGKLVTWTGAARFAAQREQAAALPGFATADGALQFDTAVKAAPSGKVKVGFGNASFDMTSIFAGFAGKEKQTVKIPLACFTAKGVDLSKIDTPFSVESDGPFIAAFAHVQVVGGAAKDKDALQCATLK
jgi:beta-glucosidase